MAQERASAALRRIEQALERIEAAALRSPSPVGDGAGIAGDQQNQALVKAHLALRSRVEGAIAQIDSLLETEERR